MDRVCQLENVPVGRLLNWVAMDLKQLGVALRERREALGLPRTELARRVGLTPTYVWMIEGAKPRSNGEPSRPTEAVLERWVRSLGMDERYLDQALRMAGYDERRATTSRTASFAAAPVHFAQPRELQARVLVEGLRDVLGLAGGSPSTWEETTGAVESFLAWLRFRLRTATDNTSELREPLLPRFARRIALFSPDEPLTDALALMREREYSQVVVQHQGRLGLLTNEGIARWFEHHPETCPAEATIGDALAYDTPESAEIMSGERTVGDAQRAFSQALEAGRPHLAAIILTNSGKPAESPIGIVTPWDLIDAPSFR